MAAETNETDEYHSGVVKARLRRYEELIPDYRNVSKDQQEPIHELTYFIVNASYHAALEIAIENNFNHSLITQLKADCGVFLDARRKERRTLFGSRSV